MHRRRPLPFALIFAVVAVAMAALASGAAAATAPTVTVTAPRTVIGPAGDVLVRVTIANSTAAPMRVLAWNTPAHGVGEPLFDVIRDGVPVDYLGPVVKRDAPTPADYLDLEPGDSIEYAVDLGALYSFAASGEYAVRYRTTAGNLLATGRSKVAGAMVSNELDMVVAGRPDPLPFPVPSVGASSATNPGCSTAEEAELATALAAANAYATSAVSYFTADLRGARYRTWFGAYTLARWQTVRSHFQALATATGGSSVRFTCHDPGCTAGTFAFVYPNAPYMVYVCGGFWAAAVTGTDSRAGTLIHEISHFTVVAATDDHAYGQSAAQNLANSNAALAVTNADSHEYFAENTPLSEAGELAATPAGDFGSQTVGTTSTTQTLTITSTGDGPATIGTVVTTGDFAVTGGTCSGSALAPAATCTVIVTFTPTATGARVGSISIPGNAIGSPVSVSVTGTGVAAPAPVVEATPPASAAPVAVTSSVRLAARVQDASRLSISVGSSRAEKWTFRIRVRRPNGSWAVVTTVRGVPGGAVRIVDLPKGRYQVVVGAGNGLVGTTSATMLLRR